LTEQQGTAPAAWPGQRVTSQQYSGVLIENHFSYWSD